MSSKTCTRMLLRSASLWMRSSWRLAPSSGGDRVAGQLGQRISRKPAGRRCQTVAYEHLTSGEPMARPRGHQHATLVLLDERYVKRQPARRHSARLTVRWSRRACRPWQPASSTPVPTPGFGAGPHHRPADCGADMCTPFEESSTRWWALPFSRFVTCCGGRRCAAACERRLPRRWEA
jgi:hypothetical protein